MSNNPVDAKIERSIKNVMPFKDDEVVKIPKNPYNNVVGSFGTILRQDDKIIGITWEGCRDRFQNNSESENFQEFLFCTSAKTVDNVLNFVRTVEEVIKLNPEDRITLKKTNSDNIIYIRFSGWWKYRIRRSLLTALLRCGQEYTWPNRECFLKALYSQYYTSQTKPAIEQFLQGRTASKLKKRNGFGGWYQLFVNKKEKDVREFLVKKKSAKPLEKANPIEDNVQE